MEPAPETTVHCPGCGARVPAVRPRFCDYCGYALPVAPPAAAASPTPDAEQIERLRATLSAAPPERKNSSMFWVFGAVLIVIVAVLLIGSLLLPVAVRPG